MNHLQLFLPCAAGVSDWLAEEIVTIVPSAQPQVLRAGVALVATWRDVLQLNLRSRLAQRVLILLHHGLYQNEKDLYQAALGVAHEAWFTPQHHFKIDITAQHCPLKSLNFAALTVKDAICDRFRDRTGQRPSVDTVNPDVRLFVHLTADEQYLYLDTSGEPLFKRGWRQDKGDAPLKETLAAAMLVASGWQQSATSAPSLDQIPPLVDPCCGSGTIVIEAAQMALNIAPGSQRRFAFERLLPHQPHVWQSLRQQALAEQKPWPADQPPRLFGSDIAHRMVDFAQRNAERAGVAAAVELRGGDALDRKPPTTDASDTGVLLLNPPYGERIQAAGRAAGNQPHRETAQTGDGSDENAFFEKLAAHWKTHYAGWTAWILTPDLKLPGKMRFKESRRIPLHNGPIECRLFRFDLMARRAKVDT